jgi:hypothetical protein
MRARIIAVAAVGCMLLSVCAHAAEYSRPGANTPGLAVDDDLELRSAGTRHVPGREVDDDSGVRSVGTMHRPGRDLDEDPEIRAAGSSRPPERYADEEVKLRGAGSSYRPGRSVDEDAPLAPAGARSAPTRAAVQPMQVKTRSDWRKASRSAEGDEVVLAKGNRTAWRSSRADSPVTVGGSSRPGRVPGDQAQAAPARPGRS